MGKDREGAYHPPKGNPSGSGREEGVGLNQPHVGSEENYLNLAEKYTEGADEMPANVKVRHPNRNVNKGENKKDGKSSSRPNRKARKETFAEDRSGVSPEELPGVLSKEAFAELANFNAEFCVSVYLPTHRKGLEVNTNTDLIPFKNALQDVANTLKGKGVDQTKIQSMLEPGYELVRNESFWRDMSQGLAVFFSEGYFKYVKMPDTPAQEMHINNSFMLKQLVNAMTVKEYFYLLVVSKKQVKCFRADAFGMTPMELPELPSGLDYTQDPADPQYQKLNNAGATHPTSGTFQGHGSNNDNQKELLAQYMEEVDDRIWDEFLHRENVPLVLAGVEYLLPIYRSVSDYKNIWPEVITGSHEHDDINSLFQQARELMEPYFRERTKKALEMYANQSATALTSSIPADVVPAAHYSRIWHLFVRKEEHIWGTFNEMENVLTVHEEKQDGDECLIDKTVIKTILNGGDVHFLSQEDMPSDSSIAALMRY